MQEVGFIPLRDIQGKESGKIEVSLTEKELNQTLIYRVVTVEAWNRRSRTAKTKNRGEVSGGGKKPWRQKGTGRARAGSNRSPLWRGGGVTFGPQPSDRKKKINRKERQKAYRQTIEDRIRKGQVVVVEAPEDFSGKAKEGHLFLDKIGREKRYLLLYENRESLLLRALRNQPTVGVRNWRRYRLTDVLRTSLLMIEKQSWAGFRRTIWKEMPAQS